jgi:ribose transport system substrate-binding protein
VIDTAGDIAAVISRIEDAVTQGVDAIVINVDPAQVEAGLAMAEEAGIPVVGHGCGHVAIPGHQRHLERVRHGGRNGGLRGQPSERAGKCRDVRLRSVPTGADPWRDRGRDFRQHAGYRGAGARHARRAGRRHRRQRAQMEALLAANPEPGSIAAVWAAWDQPALGALQAIEDAGRADEGIVIVGMDANPQARDAIAAGGNFEASMAQDFEGSARRRRMRWRASWPARPSRRR